MDLIKATVKKSTLIILPLTILTALIDWDTTGLKIAGLFGRPGLFPSSIIIGGILGLANLKGLSWGLDSLLGTYRANTRLVFLSLIRLFVVFSIIISLALLRLINLLGLLTGMSVVFMVLIVEAIRTAKKQM
ncbi:MAG: hypothetical protein AABY42_03815 [Nitrospirota bacterium]